MIKYLELEQLGKLPTKRLLAYYKKTYKRVKRFQDGLYCPCCGMQNWETDAGLYTEEQNKKREQEFKNDLATSENYINSIKEILNTREHVQKN